MPVAVTHFNDPGCPFGYSASPALAVLRWRYADQLEWRLATIGLTERSEQYVERGYTPETMARSAVTFRRYGMPFSTAPRPRVAATGRACRAVVATRLSFPDRETAALRALQRAWFTTTLLLDEDRSIADVLDAVPGLDAAAVVARLDDAEVTDAYERDRAEARTAAGGPAELQGKTAATDGPVRYTAPSLLFRSAGQCLEAGGFQPLEAYDVLLANLDPRLERRPPASSAAEALGHFPDGLTTQEVAAVMGEAPDRAAAEGELIDLVVAGVASRTAAGDDALWAARTGAAT